MGRTGTHRAGAVLHPSEQGRGRGVPVPAFLWPFGSIKGQQMWTSHDHEECVSAVRMEFTLYTYLRNSVNKAINDPPESCWWECENLTHLQRPR